jgi:L-lactate dehydrogenase complex protein LldF
MGNTLIKSSAGNFRAQAAAAIKNPVLQGSLAVLSGGFVARRAEAVARLPEFDELREEARSIKRNVMAKLDTYLEQFENKVRESGGQVHWAATAEQARETILNICRARGVKTVTKGKSMVSEEIGLNDFLSAQGIEPVETDLGEYILQIRKEVPSHIVVPAMHLSQPEITRSFVATHAHLPKERDLSAPESLVDEARQTLRPRYFAADAGITGANYLIAETGSTVIVTNEGNGDLTQNLPRLHIVISSIERVIPTLEQLSTFLRLLSRSATGQEATSYVTLSTGVKRDTDLHGPEEFHVVLLDNGRSALLGGADEEVLNCIRCGACMNHCPVYGTVGGHAYGWVYPGPIGAALTPALIGLKHSKELPNASTFCGHCVEVCPVKIPLTDIMRRWRNREHEQKLSSHPQRLLLKLWARLALRPRLYQRLARPVIRLLHRLAGRNNRYARLPWLGGWTDYRDFPAPQADTFHAQIKGLENIRYE